VHADQIAVAIADEKQDPRWLGAIANTAEAVRKLIARLGPVDRLRVRYETGQCGFVLYWQLQQMGVHCSVIAPSLALVAALQALRGAAKLRASRLSRRVLYLCS
jgi:transposase